MLDRQVPRASVMWGWLVIGGALLVAATAIALPLWVASGHEMRASSTFEVNDLHVTGNATIDGRETYKPCDAGVLATQTIFSNWSPACLATNTLITVEAGDNSGSFLTGIDAVGKAIPIGARVKLCNNGGHMDASSIVLTNLDSRSAVGNRILTPGAGAQRFCSATTTTACQVNADCPGVETCTPVVSNYAIGTDECAELEYIHPTSAPTWSEWVVQGKGRMMTAVIASINLYPVLFTDTVTGTVDSYDPTCSTPACVAAHAYVCNPGGINCGEAGDDLTFAGNTTILVSTVDATGAVIKGFKYTPSPTNVNGLGPYKVVRNLGPGPLTIRNNQSAVALDSVNDGATGDTRGDIVLLQGQSFAMWHPRETGSWFVEGKRDAWFHERDVNVDKGLVVRGNFDAGFGVPAACTVDNSSTLTAGHDGVIIRDVGNYDTTAGSITAEGLRIEMQAARSAGAPAFFQAALTLNANSATAVRSDALRVLGGNTYLGYGATSSQTEMSGNVIMERAVSFGGGDFAGTATQEICDAKTAMASSAFGALSGDSSNCYGRVTGAGAHTSTTLTFGAGGYGTSSHCWFTVESAGAGVGEILYVSTPSKTAPVVSAIDSTTGAAANLPDFSYHCVGHN